MHHSVRTYDTLHFRTLMLLANSSVRPKLMLFPRIAALPMDFFFLVWRIGKNKA